MSDQMASLFELEIEEGINDGDPYVNLPTRKACLATLTTGAAFDLLILGGGLLGVTVAHEAALQGIKVLLIEKGFFGVDALSWDVRIAHSLRTSPREVFHLRASLALLSKRRAPHLVGQMPTDSHRLEGLMARLAKRFVRIRSVDEGLLIRETVLAARQEGATIVSSVIPTFVEAESLSGCYVVGGRDLDSGAEFECRVGGIVIDPTHGELPPSRLGTHVVPRSAPEMAGIQYLVEASPKRVTSGVPFATFELTDGSFVAVSKRGVQMLEVTVLYGKKLLSAEALEGVVHEACSETGWAVQRVLGSHSIAGRWSRRYGVTQHKGVFTCTHCSAWDAFRSAEKIVSSLVALSPTPHAFRELSAKLLPGGDYACELDTFRAMARSQGISESTIEKVIERWRGRVRYIPQFPNGLRELCPDVLRGEVDLGFLSDQCVTVNDLVQGSLKLDHNPQSQNSLGVLAERLSLLREASLERA